MQVAFNHLTTFLAQAAPTSEVAEKVAPWYNSPFVLFGLLIVLIAIAMYAAIMYAKSIRYKDAGVPLGVVLSCVIFAAVVIPAKWPPKLGVDLKGGVVFVARVIANEDQIGRKDELISRLKNRIDPSNTKEISIRSLGADMIEIVIPDVDDAEADRLWNLLSQAGALQFRILAQQGAHDSEIQLATAQTLEKKRAVIDTRKPVGADGKAPVVATWVALGRSMKADGKGLGDYKMVPPFGSLVRNGRTGEIISPEPSRDEAAFTAWAEQNKLDRLEILVVNDRHNVTGDDLQIPSPGLDNQGRPIVNFSMGGSGVARFHRLTSENKGRPLGIVLDDQLLTAPNIENAIHKHGIIQGNFTSSEVEGLVTILKSGRLPGSLSKNWISKDKQDSNLGEEMQRKGVFACAASLLVVIVFMIWYYRFSGVIASIVLLINVGLIFACVMLISFPFSLPTLAGLVLTVGMSVDANVLIFERMREEINGGATIRMAIRNGFGRAMSTIIDANLTTFITGVILYAMGNEHIRGFTVILILGIILGVFTAVYCARVLFDIAERTRILTKLNMVQWVKSPQYDFVGRWRAFFTASVVLGVVGIVAIAIRGTEIFAHDLAGGTSMRLVLNKPMEVKEVREKLVNRFKDGQVKYNGIEHTVEVSKVNAEGMDNRVYKIDTSIRPWEDPDFDPKKGGKPKDPPSDYPTVEKIVNEVFGKDLAHYEVKYSAPVFTDVAVTPAPSGTGASTPALTPPATDSTPATPATGTETAPAKEPEATTPPATETKTPEPAATPATEPAKAPEAEKAPETEKTPEAEKTPAEAPKQSGLNRSGLQFVNLVIRSADPQDDKKEEPAKTEPAQTEPAKTEPAQTEPAKTEEKPAEAAPAPAAQTPATETKAEATPPTTTPATTEAQGGGSLPTGSAQTAAPAPAKRVSGTVELEFTYPISSESLMQQILGISEKLNAGISDTDVTLTPNDDGLTDEEKADSKTEAKKWKAAIVGTEAGINDVLKSFSESMAERAYIPSSAGVGGQLAVTAQVQALGAIFLAMVGIVLYVWVRFQNVFYGIAAVAALVHDVILTVGAIAVSYWFADFMGFLLIDNFKISLSVIAALLTIIGYSINDTIVVFDRIREIKGKNPNLTPEILNKSLGQTLSRTILTSFTTWIVVLILFFFGGESIHAFSFSLVVGILVGTYSSIFIASPILFWFAGVPGKPAKAS